jgi:hypothetical protein
MAEEEAKNPPLKDGITSIIRDENTPLERKSRTIHNKNFISPQVLHS